MAMMDTERVAYFMEELVPFNKFLGMKFTDVCSDSVTLMLPFKEEFVGDPGRRALHGGVIASVLDVAGGTVCWASLNDVTARVSTVDIRIDYLRKGPCEDLLCTATILRTGNKVAVARMELVAASNPTVLIATGQAVYNVVRKLD